jgi:hypothetical protein
MFMLEILLCRTPEYQITAALIEINQITKWSVT